MPAAPGPSWRGSSDAALRGGVRSWRRPGSGGSPALPLRSRWLRKFLSLLSTGLALAAIAIFIFLVFVPGCTQTRFAILAPAPYANDGMSPFPFAQQDREAFRAAFSADSLSEMLSGKSPAAAGASRGGSKSPLLLFVASMAGQTDKGVILYPVDAGPDDAEGAISIDQIWDFLKARPANEKKILVIDLARGPVDARWGQFVHPFPGTASSENKLSIPEAAAGISNLAVMTSAAPGEVSWTSSAFSRSVFAQFVIRALAGEADGIGSRPRDRRVTLGEVYDFVLTNVDHWVLQNRDLRGQHPQLLMTSGAQESLLETVLAEVQGRPSSPAVETGKTPDGTRIRQLEAIWEARDKWISRNPEQWNPIGWRRLLEHLRRAEQWRLAGQSEGMERHLEAAQKANEDLERSYSNRSPDLAEFPFVAASLSRAGGATSVPDTLPVQPARQLQAAFQAFAPADLPKAVQEASLRLRGAAESQAWQGYRPQLWTGDLLASADRDRRLSEDLLFVGAKAELERSDTLLKSAVAKLKQRETIIRQLSDAHLLHSRLLAELPDLASWAAQRLAVEGRSESSQESGRLAIMKQYSLGIDETGFRLPPLEVQSKLRDETDEFLQQIEVDLLVIFEQTRQLTQLLDRELSPEWSFATDSTWSAELDRVSKAINDPERGFQIVKERLIRHARGLIGATIADIAPSTGEDLGQPQYFHWLRLRNALQWSGLPAELRRSLFAELEESDRILEANSQKVPVETDVSWNGDNWAGVDGCWQAFWALQTVSLGSPRNAVHELWVQWKIAVLDPAKQIGLLVELGESVRREFRDRVNRAEPTLTSVDQPEEVLRTLLAAERAARTLHGYDACLFSMERDPLRRLRDFDVGALCVVQADRYIEDFWDKVASTDREAWYVQSANQCLRAAEIQARRQSIPALKSMGESAAQRLQTRQTARLGIGAHDAQIDLSLATQRRANIGAAFGDQLPSGAAACWLNEESTGAESLLRFESPGRAAVTAAEPRADWQIVKLRTPPAAACGLITVRPRLLFRARFWDSDADVLQVNPCPPDSITQEFREHAPNGEVVVFGSDRRDTIFILDCSRSMQQASDKAGTTRFQAARTVFKAALGDLRNRQSAANQTEPFVIGLMAYGHRVEDKDGKSETVDARQSPDWKRPVPKRVIDDWRNDFETLVPLATLSDDQFDRMTSYLEELGPVGQTPLLGAIREAADTLIQRKRGGVIVAITDGAFNDASITSSKYTGLKDLLQEHPELSLQIVAFGIDPGVKGNKAEFESLRKLGEDTHGTTVSAPTGEELAKSIASVMRPRKYGVIRDAQPREEIYSDLGESIEDREPHDYLVRFPGLADFPVTIVGGERLEFDLDLAAGRLRHRRPQPQLFRRAEGPSAFSQDEPTRLGYLKADYDRTLRRADLSLSLDRDDSLGMVRRPAEIRLQVTPRGEQRQTSRSWMLSPAQSIPVWDISLRDWPADSQPEVQAFWKMSRTDPDAAFELKPEPQQPMLPEWTEGSLVVTAERQSGKILVRLQGSESAGALSVADVRVEIGRKSSVEGRFLPDPFNWSSQLFETQRQITYQFDVGDGLDPAGVWIGLTSRESLDRDARRLESPLVIEKWDREQ